ncbi:MAG: cobalamin-independent methionine synthase II family protein [Chloroflexi bacterium]|nr:cobalamin-independent methionine synthase II family protein [Chloroflexota bacterium]
MSLDALRTDIVGSFRRPDTLQDAYRRHERGEIDDSDLEAERQACIRTLIEHEEAHGVAVVSDGEFRRINFQDSWANSVAGYDAPRTTYALMDAFHARGGPGNLVTAEAAPVAAGAARVAVDLTARGPAVLTRRPAEARLRLAENVPLTEYRFATSCTSRPVKVTLVGPDRISQRFDYAGSVGVYEGLDDFVDDVVRLQRQMVAELAEAGCRYVQHDEPGYTSYVDPPSIVAMRRRGEDPGRNLQRSIDADNAIIDGFPEVTFGIHVCRGNPPGGFHREGHYDAIAEQLFGQLRHQRLLLEYDSERAGGFEPLRFVRKGAVAVLGLVSTKLPEVESVDDVVRRIEQASRFLPVEQLAVSPQCGFGHFAEDIQWRKLDVVREAARRVWG